MQILLLAYFSVFAFFNYLYGFASLRKIRLPIGKHGTPKIAVVVVAYNERHVLVETVRACERLTYENKVIILADDSDDEELVSELRSLAKSKGCENKSSDVSDVELWESKDFVLIHRDKNIGFKGGSLQKVDAYLESIEVDHMYLLDADWHPQPDILERSMEILAGSDGAAFVQTKRISFPDDMNRFQRYVTIIEEGCYHVDFEGRQTLNHPILFSGCCTLFDLNAIRAAGGFTPGHLTEDLDLTNRLWLLGGHGVYAGHLVNHGEVPFVYDHYRRQQERWSSGSARALRDYFIQLVRSDKLSFAQKLSALRQNAYFTTTLVTSFAVLFGISTLFWIATGWNSYPVESYLYMLSHVKAPMLLILYLCIASNIFEPLLMVLVKTRRYLDILHLPMMVWYAWSVLTTYAIGNLKGLLNVDLGWFRTPKFLRGERPRKHSSSPITYRAVNVAIFSGLACLYFAEGFIFGWFDEFVLLLLPAFALASVE